MLCLDAQDGSLSFVVSPAAGSGSGRILGRVNIVVAVKQAATLDEEFSLLDGPPRVDPDDLDWSANEWDAYAVEAALQLRDAAGSGRVVAVSVGDETEEESLLAALAMGADAAVRVAGDAVDRDDPIAVARVLAAVVEREHPDLVLCGAQSSDLAHAATGVALAGVLDLARVAVVRRIEAGTDGLVVDRELEGGTVERLRIGLPALLTVQTGINEPRYVNLRAIKHARDKPLEVLNADDLVASDTGARPAARAIALTVASAAGQAEQITGSAAEIAARITDIVKEATAA